MRLPAQFQAASEHVTEEAVAEVVVCGADPDAHLDAIRAFEDAGDTGLTIHQIGPDQAALFALYRDQVMPRLTSDAGVAA